MRLRRHTHKMPAKAMDIGYYEEKARKKHTPLTDAQKAARKKAADKKKA